MSIETITTHETVRPAALGQEKGSPLVLDPYLHFGPDRVYNPLTDRTLLAAEVGYDALLRLAAGAVSLREVGDATVGQLRDEGWLVDPAADLDGRFYLKYVSLEAHTVCNQACYFCPVSIDPRKSYFMPHEKYEDILRQLSEFRSTLELLSMIHYNEPTIDPWFIERVRMIKSYGLRPAVLSNASGLTPAKTDALLELGGLEFFSVNLSTLDRERYRHDRGADHLNQVLRNLDYACDKPFSKTMDMVVLGTGDEQHKRDFEAICERYGKSLFNVKYFEVNDRAGHLEVGLKVEERKQRLAGCELVGSRPLQHLHITPHAKCVLCCQDYHASYVVGDLNEKTVREVLTGPAMKLMRRWAYGRDEAPDDFICRGCEFALVR
ncbi:MAG: radical SAM protein [Thermoanaerobaculia bacterium]|nr:radical SAM protein [Thermoanaerobaculia bacterium]